MHRARCGVRDLRLTLSAPTQFLPPRFALMPAPGPDWTAAHARWAGPLVAAAVCLAVASRDRAARRHTWQNH